MSLAFAPFGKIFTVTDMKMDDKTKRHLGNLGILIGTELVSVFDNKGDVIIKVKDSKLAINKALALKIIVA